MPALRVALMTHGTRGDVQVLVALGRELAGRGHQPVLAVPGGFVGFVRDAGLTAHPLPADWRAFLTDTSADRSWLHAGDTAAVLGGLREVLGTHAGEIARALHGVGADADLIVSGALTEDIATVIAEAGHVPLGLLHLFPFRRNDKLANPFVTGYSATPEENLATHLAYERSNWQARRAGVNQFRAALGLAETELTTAERAGAIGAVELQAYSPNLVEGIDWPDSRPFVGWLELDPAGRHAVGEYGVDVRLAAWLDEGEPPGYFGFGSMPVADPAATLRMIEEVVTEQDTRAVVAAGWAELPAGVIRDGHRVRVVDSVHHGALLPRCAFAVHHGGSGTTGATSRAGVPTLVTSVMLDQTMWGEVVRRHGAGLHLPMSEVDRTTLATAVEGLRTPEIASRAAALGRAVRAEPDQVAAAADILIAHAKR